MKAGAPACRAIRATILGAGLLMAAGCGPGDPPSSSSSPSPEPWFEDVTEAAGISFVHLGAPQPRFLFPEIMSGGAAWIDYDGDGWLDLYLVQGESPDPGPPEATTNRLYRNLGDGGFVDVTEKAGVGDPGFGMGCAVGDIDNDGDPDLYVTNVGANRLFRNDGGRFTDITFEAGVGDDGWGASAAFFDYDQDGLLDLFVVNYISWTAEQEIECYSGGRRDYCLPANYETPATDVLFRNEGDGTFADNTQAAGLHVAKGNGLGIAPGDYDRDGDIDLYVANDGLPNQLWINRGDGTFADRSLISGTAVNRQGLSEASMGVTASDIDGNGELDLLLTHLRDETNTLYLNRDGLFEDATIRFGLAAPSIQSTGFGVGTADFDNDGRLDIYIANGRVGITRGPPGESQLAEPDHLYRGLAEGGFGLLSPEAAFGLDTPSNSRAAAFADYDNDGDVDVLVVTNGGRVRLLRNLAGERGRWIGFQAVDNSGREASGAVVRLTGGGPSQARQVERAYSYQSSNDPRLHFGLGEDDRVETVEVRWPGGSTELFGPFPSNQRHLLRKGRGR